MLFKKYARPTGLSRYSSMPVNSKVKTNSWEKGSYNIPDYDVVVVINVRVGMNIDTTIMYCYLNLHGKWFPVNQLYNYRFD